MQAEEKHDATSGPRRRQREQPRPRREERARGGTLVVVPFCI
jgi:hypothetical protein